MTQLDFAWLVADTLNALMAIPNLIALLLLSPVVFPPDPGVFRQGQELSLGDGDAQTRGFRSGKAC